MGMTKALQERVFISANLYCPNTRFVGARYGNVLASRGSVIPLFHDQIRSGGPVTITTTDMTRFLLSLEQAVDTILNAVAFAKRGEIFIPRVPAAKVTDIAKILIGDRDIETRVTGIRPGEKVHESLISEEEATRTVVRGDYYAIRPMLSEIDESVGASPALVGEFSSDRFVMNESETAKLLASNKLMLEDASELSDELLR
jgi:UDP-glucose 4-epimerase